MSILIIGAGNAGQQLAQSLKNQSEIILGFLDDNQKGPVNGFPVLGLLSDLEKIVKEHDIGKIFVAIPSVKSKAILDITATSKQYRIPIQIVPSLPEIIDGTVKISALRDVEIEDVLGRAVQKSNINAAREALKDKKILVTGAAGSIGSVLVSQLVLVKSQALIALDNWEWGLYSLQEKFNLKNFHVVLGDVKNYTSLESTIKKFKPDYVFHAAAYKHVPLLEEHPREAVRNNIQGTKNLIEVCIKNNVRSLTIISTDKAVNPSSIMGATKRCTERLLEAYDAKTKMNAVRFGNVLGSNGSIVPKFKKQIEQGGPVTVTHKEVTRYFMTIEEAAHLVIQASLLGRNREIFVLDMGKPIAIYDLACNMIRLSGFEPEKDIPIEITGLRPGEKLHEELLIDESKCQKTDNDKIFIATKETPMNKDQFLNDIEKFLKNIDSLDREQIIQELIKLVPGYSPL